MKVKRIVALLISIIAFTYIIPLQPCTYANDSYNFQSAEEIVDYINNYIKKEYGISYDYYPKTMDIKLYDDDNRHIDTLRNQSINYNQIWKEWNSRKNGENYLLNPVVYGTNATKRVGTNPEKHIWLNAYVKTIGYDKFGNHIVPYRDDNGNRYDGFYKWKSGWTGNELREVSQSYNDVATWTNDSPGEKNTLANSKETTRVVNNRCSDLNELIQAGMDDVWGGITGSYVTTNSSQKNKIVHTTGKGPANGGDWTDYLLIVVPPTDISWGLAWRFNGSNRTGKWFTIEIPIAPRNKAIPPCDLGVDYLVYRDSAEYDETVTFEAEVSEEEDRKVDDLSYEWDVRDVDGNPVNVDYGDGTSVSGRINLKKGKSRKFRMQFSMPMKDVVVSFKVNQDKRIRESNYENNQAEIDPVTVKFLEPELAGNIGTFDVDYDIYARRIQFNLGNITAPFPSKKWTSTGTANYDMRVDAETLRDSSYSASRVVDSAPFTVNPFITTHVYRDGIGDNPYLRAWLPNGEYSNNEYVTMYGDAHRRYKYYTYNSKGKRRTRYSTYYTSFRPRRVELTANIKVYNGLPTLNSPYIGSGVSDSHLQWPSTPIWFNVTRDMYFMDEYGNRSAKVDMPGQYGRAFVGQNMADIVWASEVTQASGYAKDRATAKNRGTKYNLAVFATGKDFERVDYPMKSGYMFNPVGTYVCTVKSTVYCDRDLSMEEKLRAHRELVNGVKNSFVYNNEMQYTTNGNDVYYFKNVNNSKTSGILKITTARDTSNVSDISIPEYEPFMEGYESSGTLSSHTNYRYREYLAAHRVHRIDAETVLRFTISTPSTRYTNVKMPDGAYKVTVKSNPFAFQGMTVPAKNLFDEISVKVRGSLYDDRN